jgi:hypothetical protein
VKIGDEKVNPDDYMEYTYDPADYHGPPFEIATYE